MNLKHQNIFLTICVLMVVSQISNSLRVTGEAHATHSAKLSHLEEFATSLEEIDTLLSQNNGRAFVFFTTSWCGPCKSIKAYVTQKTS